MRRLISFLARRLVPAVLAGVGGWMVAATYGIPWGAAAALVVAALVEAALAWIRRAPRRRRLFRLAAAAHVVVWSVVGALRTPTDPPGAVRVVDAVRASAFGAVRAGFGAATFDLPAETPLAGWGSPPRRIGLPAYGGLGPIGALSFAHQGARDGDGAPRRALFRHPEGPDRGESMGARALWIEASGGAPLVVVSLDLVTSSRPLHDAVAQRLAADGVRPGGLILAATHTHSGPGGFRRERFAAIAGTDHFDPRVEAAITNATVDAIRAARTAATEASLSWAEVTLDPAQPLGQRRGVGGEPNDRLAALLVRRSDGSPSGTLLHAAIHPTVLRRSHARFDGDLATALAQRFGAALGGVPVVFVNGALGDVSPASSREGSQGAARLDELARRAFPGTRPPLVERVLAADRHAQAAISFACAERDPGTPRVVVGWGSGLALHDAADRPFFQGGSSAVLADSLMLPLNVLAWSLFLPDLRFVAATGPGAFGVRMNLDDLVGREPLFAGVVRIDVPGEGKDLAWLWSSGEATTEIGRGWEEAAVAKDDVDPWVLGLANGGCAYLADDAHLEFRTYEGVATLYGARSARHVGDLLDVALSATR